MKNNKFKVLAWNKLMQCYGVTGNYLCSEYLCTTKTVSLGIYREDRARLFLDVRCGCTGGNRHKLEHRNKKQFSPGGQTLE